MLYGRTAASLPSRFLREIPEECVVRKGGYRRPVQEFTGGYGNSYQMRQNMAGKPAPQSMASTILSSQSAPILELNPGDMIQHAAFGRGMVLSVMKMGGDALLEIAFDDIGTKKLMAKTASVHMKKL